VQLLLIHATVFRLAMSTEKSKDMKRLIAFVIPLLLLSCTKEAEEGNHELRDLIITETSTTPTASLEGSIVSRMKCYGPDLCYRFRQFEIKETSPRQYDIRAKATYPKGNVFCPQALYEVDTTININPATTGQYVLRFYNNNTLFKADTVQVN
jgi:hypothetical protein